MSPKSSGDVLICLRSMARIAPSLIGSSYCLPVRLSTTVSVSFIAPADVGAAAFLSVVTLFAIVLVLVLVVGRRHRFVWHAIGSFRPSRQVFVAAPFAAEWTPLRVHGTCAADDAQRSVAHPVNDSWLKAQGSRLQVPEALSLESEASSDGRVRRVMANIQRRDHEDHIFRDIGRMIADPLQMT